MKPVDLLPLAASVTSPWGALAVAMVLAFCVWRHGRR